MAMVHPKGEASAGERSRPSLYPNPASGLGADDQQRHSDGAAYQRPPGVSTVDGGKRRYSDSSAYQPKSALVDGAPRRHTDGAIHPPTSNMYGKIDEHRKSAGTHPAQASDSDSTASADKTDVEATATKATKPHRKRKVRDMFPFLLFIANVVGMAEVFRQSWTKGTPERHLMGVDSWGNICGFASNEPIEGVSSSGKDRSQHQYEFRFALLDIEHFLDPNQYLRESTKHAKLCVAECPKKVTTCEKFLTDNGYNLQDAVMKNRVCTVSLGIVLPHTTLANRCLPNLLSVVNLMKTENEREANMVGNGMTSLIESAFAQVSFAMVSVQNYKWDICYILLASILLALILMLLTRLVTRIMLYTVMVVVVLGGGALTGFLWYQYGIASGRIKEGAASQLIEDVIPADVRSRFEGLDSYASEQNLNVSISNNATVVEVATLNKFLNTESLRESEYLLPLAIVVLVVFIVLTVIIIWSRKSVGLVIGLFDEAGKAIFSQPLLLAQPFITMICTIALIIYFLVVVAHLFSVGVAYVDDDGLVNYQDDPAFPVIGLTAFHVFSTLWLLQFVSGCEQVVVAGAVGQWFFSATRRKCNCRACPIFRPTVDLILYNLGSVAIGALLVAIVQFLRIMLAYLQHKMKNVASDGMKFVMCCLQCCLRCLECVLKYINRNAYICVALYGDSFFGGAKRAVTLLIANATHTIVVKSISTFFIFLGKISTVIATGAFAVIYFHHIKFEGEVSSSLSYIVPVMIGCIGAYIISNAFFNIYSMAIDTIFICFCDDQNRNNGDDLPYYSTKQLQQYMRGAAKPAKSKSSNKVAAE